MYFNNEQKFWDLHSLTYKYKSIISPYQERMNDVYNALLPLAGKNVLDAGCGVGYFTSLLAEKNHHTNIKAVDLSPKMLKKAMSRCNKFPNVDFKLIDLNRETDLPSESIHRIVCDNVLYTLPRPEFTLTNFFRILTTGGKLVIVMPMKEINPRALMKSSWRSIRGPIKKLQFFILTLYATPMILPFESLISRKIDNGNYNSLTDTDIQLVLEKIGFRDISISTTMAKQNWLISCYK